MSEINCAFGLLQLKYIDALLHRRGEIAAAYRTGIDEIAGLDYLDLALGEVKSNHAYFPILVRPDYPISRDDLYHRMKAQGVHPRRYFYPLISDFAMYRGFPSANPDNLPVARALADQVLCLPIYPDLDDLSVERILGLIRLT